MNSLPHRPSADRRDALRDALPAIVQLLQGRRAAEIEPGDIDAYVALDWLEWAGGTLKLTVTGDNVLRQSASRRGD
jgi:YbbR domain-containing protein